MERKMEIAEEIVKQLGGRRFIIMTGAFDFLALDGRVRLKLPNDKEFVKQGINLVTVILTSSDTYRVLFKKGDETVSEFENIYND